MFGINPTELLLLLALAMVLIGPERLPEFVVKLRDWVKQMREMADGAKSQLKEQMGPEFEDIDWRQYDPRQYDPRRIVRQALFDEPADPKQASAAGAAAAAAAAAAGTTGAAPAPSAAVASATRPTTAFDPDRSTPYDLDAT